MSTQDDESIFSKLAEGEGEETPSVNALTCPKCGETERARHVQHQFGMTRECLACGEKWPGGSMVAQADQRFPTSLQRMDTRPVEEPDPDIDFTPGYRDPGRNWDYGGEDY